MENIDANPFEVSTDILSISCYEVGIMFSMLDFQRCLLFTTT